MRGFVGMSASNGEWWKWLSCRIVGRMPGNESLGALVQCDARPSGPPGWSFGAIPRLQRRDPGSDDERNRRRCRDEQQETHSQIAAGGCQQRGCLRQRQCELLEV